MQRAAAIAFFAERMLDRQELAWRVRMLTGGNIDPAAVTLEELARALHPEFRGNAPATLMALVGRTVPEVTDSRRRSVADAGSIVSSAYAQLTLEQRADLDRFMVKLIAEVRPEFYADFPQFRPKEGQSTAALTEQIVQIIRSSPKPISTAEVIAAIAAADPIGATPSRAQSIRTLLATLCVSKPGAPARWRRVARGLYWRHVV